MKVSLYNQKAEVIGEVELNPKIFEVKPNSHLLAEAVRVQLSNARQSAAHTKTRGEIRGGGRKPWKQKGTGRARVGSSRSPIWRHGGVTFGPRSSRNWELKLNKKAKTKALFMGLSDKAADSKFIVIEKIVLEQPKTREFVKILASFSKNAKATDKKFILVLPKKDDALFRSSRNIQNISVVLANSLNIVDVIKANAILALKESLPVIEKTYLRIDKNDKI